MQAVAKSIPRACSLIVPKRSFHPMFVGPAVSGPPRVRISLAEKFIHAAIMNVAFFSFPVWVLTHMEEYKGNA